MLKKLEEFVIQGCHSNISNKVSCVYRSYTIYGQILRDVHFTNVTSLHQVTRHTFHYHSIVTSMK